MVNIFLNIAYRYKFFQKYSAYMRPDVNPQPLPNQARDFSTIAKVDIDLNALEFKVNEY